MSDKISYILEVNDQYTASIKDFLSHLDKITDKLKGVSSQEKKNHTARVNYSKIQREEWREHKQWMHDERMSLSKKIFLEKQLGQTKKASALAEKDYAIAGAVNLQTLAKKQLLNKRAVNDLSLVRVEEQRIFANRMKANQMLTSSAIMAPSGAYTKVAFNKQLGKFESIEKAPKPDSPYKYGMAGGILGKLSGSGVMAGLGFAGAAYTVGRSVKYVHDTTAEMDGLRAALSALIPTVKGLEGSTPEKEIKYLRDATDKYGMDFSASSEAYMKMMATGGKVDAKLARGLTEAIGGYAGLINLDTEATGRVYLAVRDMLTKQVLNAQEVHLQMANVPGGQTMLHKAYYNVVKREYEAKGQKSPVTKENMSAYFESAMRTGKLSSEIILREFVNVIFEEFGEAMIKKSHTLRKEETKLKNASQELATIVGQTAYPAMTGAVKGMTKILKEAISYTDKLKDIRNTVGDYVNQNKENDKVWQDKLRKEDSKNSWNAGNTVKGVGNIIGKGFTAANEIAKLPVNTAFEAAMGIMTGDFSGIAKPAAEFNKFGASIFDGMVNTGASIFDGMVNTGASIAGAGTSSLLIRLINLLIQKEQNPQKVEVKIVAENMPDFFTVKKEQNMPLWRPQTIGGR